MPKSKSIVSVTVDIPAGLVNRLPAQRTRQKLKLSCNCEICRVEAGDRLRAFYGQNYGVTFQQAVVSQLRVAIKGAK